VTDGQNNEKSVEHVITQFCLITMRESYT